MWSLDDSADRLIVIFSDVEMGSGGETDDFPHSGFLARLLLSYLQKPSVPYPIDFVFNGDTFDLVKTPYCGAYPHHITKDVAVNKMTAVASAHPEFFGALCEVLEHPGRENAVHFIVGNHDAELLFPDVQQVVRGLCKNNVTVHFPGFELALGPVHVEHGSQSDPLFRIDPERPFINANGQQLLNISWTTVALLDVFMPLHPLFHFHNRLRPRNLLIERVPEIKELLMAKAWRYWTDNFWRDFIALKDPLLKFNWTIIKEIVRRLINNGPDVSIDRAWVTNTVQKSPFELFVKGHLHRAGIVHHGTKRILQTGCFRDEYLVIDGGKSFRPILKPYLEIYLKNNQILGIVTKEVKGPERRLESFPHSIFDVVPEVRKLLEEFEDKSYDRSRMETAGIRSNEEELQPSDSLSCS
jgi:UDP-2,3-diacylglucosamine pyrophosphatase LpxH